MTSIKLFALLALALLSAALARPAAAQTNGDLKVCQNFKADPDDVIAACGKFLRTRRTVDGRPAPAGALSSISYLRALAYSKKGLPDRTIEDSNQGLVFNPNNFAFYNLRAMAYVQKGNTERALADYTTAIARFVGNRPVLAEVHHNRGLLYSSEGDFTKALADYTQAINYDPKRTGAYLQRAETYIHLGDSARANADYKEAQLQVPSNRAMIEDTRTLEVGWLNYLKDIQQDGDYGNWDGPPLDKLRGPGATLASLPPASGSCADAAVHWQSVESIKTRAAYEDHLARFPACAFAALATARIDAMSGRVAKTCPAGQTLDGDGDCVKPKKPAATAARQRPQRAAQPSASAPAALDCSTPAGLFACANHALSRTPLTGRGTDE